MIELFTTIPQSTKFEDGHSFTEEVRKVARNSEEYGFKGTLIYSDNRLPDPWAVAQVLINETTNLLPMISVQPLYMHPYTVAKKVASIALIYNRKVALNFVTGGFKKELEALDDHVSHDKRYDRLQEYAEIIQLFLKSDQPINYEGEFYQINKLKLKPAIPAELYPEYYLSGSSEAAKSTAANINAGLIENPDPAEEYNKYSKQPVDDSAGIRLGVLSRESHREAWALARVRFPETNEGKLTHKLANKVSDSVWHQQLSGFEGNTAYKNQQNEPVYWLSPFNHYHTFCPYLVGCFEEVADELRKYIKAGYGTCILDIPATREELRYTKHIFKLANVQLQERYNDIRMG